MADEKQIVVAYMNSDGKLSVHSYERYQTTENPQALDKMRLFMDRAKVQVYITEDVPSREFRSIDGYVSMNYR